MSSVNNHYLCNPVYLLAEIYAVLACVYKIQFQNRPEKYRSICTDSQVALKALQAVRTMSPLVQQCQKALNNISARHAVGLYWVAGHAGVWGNEITNELARGSPILGFLGPELALRVSRQDIWRYTKKYKSFVGQPAKGKMARSLRYPKTGSKTNLRTLSGCQG